MTNGPGRLITKTLLFTVLLPVAACSSDSGGDTPTVVATTTMLADIVRNVVADDVDVEILIGVGVDPHEFSPSSQQAASIVSADLVVANGLGLEAGLADVLTEAVETGANVIFVGEHVEPLEFGGADAGPCKISDDHTADGCDPHFWMDPSRVALASHAIAQALDDAGLVGPWVARASAYESAISEVDSEIFDIFDAIPAESRLLVTNHDSLGYFARRYGFEVVGVIIPGGSTLGDPSSAELAKLVALINGRGVRAIFVDSPDSTALADALAAELDDQVAVVPLYGGSLGPEDSEARSLTGMLLVDASVIAKALR